LKQGHPLKNPGLPSTIVNPAKVKSNQIRMNLLYTLLYFYRELLIVYLWTFQQNMTSLVIH